MSRFVASMVLAGVLASSFVIPMPETAGAYGESSNWPTYLGGPERSGFAAAESLITASTAPSLTTRWRLTAPAAVSAQPAVSGGMVYWGSWDGYEHGTTIFGKTLWSTNLGTTFAGSGCLAHAVGVASSATVASVTIAGSKHRIVLVGGGDAQVYALDAFDGSVLWHTPLGPPSANFVWSSPLVDQGKIFIGIASFGDCPLTQGKVFKIDAATGRITRVFKVAPNGCTGDAVWGSPTLDAGARTIYFASGNAGSCSGPEPLGQSVVEVNERDLSLAGSWQVPTSEQVSDGDFGSTPTLFTAVLGGVATPMVGLVNKSGWWYAFRRDQLSSGPVWQDRIAAGGSEPQNGTGNISPSAWDGSRLYVAGGGTTINGRVCAGGLRAVDPSTGAYLWEDCLTAPVLGAVQCAPGIVEVAYGRIVLIVNAATGHVLMRLVTAGAKFWGPAAISEGTIYQGDMNGRFLALSPSADF